MESQIDFDINESLKQYLSDPSSIPTPDADPSLADCETDPEGVTAQVVNAALNPVVDAIAENPESLTRGPVFDTLQFLLKCAPISVPHAKSGYEPRPDGEFFALCRYSSVITGPGLSKILDTVVSGLSAESDLVHNELESEESEAVQHHKQLLEAYGFLLQWTIAAVETKSTEKSASTSASVIRGRAGKGGKAKQAKDVWDPSSQVQAALEIMSKTLKLKLGRIFPTTSERDTFVSLSTRAVYLVLENEARVKSMAIRMHSFKVLCIAIKHHGHAYGEIWRPSAIGSH